MGLLWPDTSETVEQVAVELYRRKSAEERIALAAETTEFLRNMVKVSVVREHPGADERELRCRFAARWLGRDWALRVYGWDPEQKGW